MKRVFSGLLVVALIGLGVFTVGCGRMIEPGPTPDTTAPTVTLTVPVNNAVGVARGNKITATFSEAMDPATIISPATTFTLKKGATAVAGTVTYTGVTAVFTPAANLTAGTAYVATITTAAKDLAGNALAVTKTWSFTTGTATDATAPTVTLTSPLDGAVNVAINKKLSAVFSEAMDPTTITDATFTLKQGTTAVAGAATYSGVTAVFVPTTNLAAGTTYTATISTGVEDLAGNPLAAAKSWSFTTSASGTIDTTPPTVLSTIPLDLAIDVAVNSDITATFDEAMDPLTITNLTFTLTQGTTTIEGDVTYAGNIATFNPTGNLAAGTTYIAKITTGAQDLSENALAAEKTWSFRTVGWLAPGAAPLGLAGTFGVMGWSGFTTANASVIHGDVAVHGVAGTMTGFPPGEVTGTIYTDDTAPLVEADLLAAYNFAWAQPTTVTLTAGADQGAIYPLGMPPGVYESPSTILIGTPLVLDAGGNPDAVWIFKIGSSLTTSGTGSVTLTGGAQQKNVFFVPFAAATIGTNTNFYGNILAGGSITCSGNNTIYGRLLSGATGSGTIALNGVASTVHVPAP